MPLPKIAVPTYELEVPSLKKNIKYRPFLVKEEKILIIAMESEDTKQIAEAVKTVISKSPFFTGTKTSFSFFPDLRKMVNHRSIIALTMLTIRIALRCLLI